ALCGRLPPEPASAAAHRINAPTGLPSGFLTEPDARRLLEAAGIPTTHWRFARSADEAVRAAGEIGGAVVIKAVSPQIVHKSDVGGVVLGVQGEQAVREACTKIAHAITA